MVSIIITSFKEHKTIGKCIECIGNSKYSGITRPFEIIQVSPDELTLKAGRKAANKLALNKKEYIQIVDPQKGKPHALKMAIAKAKGDILIFTDGDTYFAENAVRELLKPFENTKIGGVSGRPVSNDNSDNKFAYWGRLLSSSGDHRRRATMEKVSDKNYYVSDQTFFPMSGYIMATRNMKIDIPQDVLSDDAYISYTIRNKGLEIAYMPDAVCYVKFANNIKDYYKQKVRSLGGFKQLEQYGIFQRDKQSRSFLIELPYAIYALSFPKTIKEFYWSLQLFPVRLWTWLRIFWERTVIKKDFQKTWVRIESTK